MFLKNKMDIIAVIYDFLTISLQDIGSQGPLQLPLFFMWLNCKLLQPFLGKGSTLVSLTLSMLLCLYFFFCFLLCFFLQSYPSSKVVSLESWWGGDELMPFLIIAKKWQHPWLKFELGFLISFSVPHFGAGGH